jgi:hypothetical protein
MSSLAFSSSTASLPSRVTVSTSIMARSAAENARTCEYRQRRSIPSSTAQISFIMSDCSHRSACSRHQRHSCGPSACRTSPMLRTRRSKSSRLLSSSTRCARAGTEHRFRHAMKISRLGRHPCARKLQTMTAERNFRRREDTDFCFSHDASH